MLRGTLLGIVCLLAFVVIGDAVAAGPAAPEPQKISGAGAPTGAIVPLSEVRAGMPAFVRTVVSGDRTEDLPVEIVGVMENALGPGQSLILARLHGDTADFTGVAAGMSGSPVYSEGRLIGALSYRIGQFPKEPIAGITPIEYMLGISKSARRDGTAPAVRGNLSSMTTSGEPRLPLLAAAPPTPSAMATAEAGAGGASLVPIDTPLVLSGVPGEVLASFTGDFRALGVTAVAGASGSGAAPAGSVPRAIRPGDAIAAQLIRGDISAAATGTVTHVDGDRIYAFGHPVLLSGETEFPMARAEIYLTLASLSAPMKIPRILDTVGTWEQSRLPGTSGVTSRVPGMVQLKVSVETPGRSSTYRYEVASHRDWTPLLVATSVASSLVNTPSFSDEGTLTASGRVVMDGHPDLRFEDLYTGFAQGSSAALAMARDLQGIFGAVYQNRFESPNVRSIEITTRGIEQGRLTFLEGVWPSRSEASPGDDVEYRVRMRSFRGESVTRTFKFRVPENAPHGDLQVLIGGGGFMLTMERQVLGRRVAGADNLDQIIEIVNQLRTSDTVYAKAVRRLPGAVVQSELMPALPPSIFTTVRSNRGSGDVAPLTESTVWEDKIQVQSIVVGGTALTLRIR